MYAYLKGLLIESTPSHVIVETQQMGFYLHIPAHTFSQLPSIGQEIKLFTSFIVRENAQTLYGFLTRGEKQLFEALLEVSGIGPKLALSLCGHLPLNDLLGAITRNDIPLLTKVPGIGKKTAERLILDLRDKVSSLFIHSPIEYQIAQPDQKTDDALSALVHLGYNQATAQKALQKSLKEFPDLPLGELITAALRNI